MGHTETTLLTLNLRYIKSTSFCYHPILVSISPANNSQIFSTRFNLAKYYSAHFSLEIFTKLMCITFVCEIPECQIEKNQFHLLKVEKCITTISDDKNLLSGLISKK